MKEKWYNGGFFPQMKEKLRATMLLRLVLVLGICLCMLGTAFAQTKKVTLDVKDAPLEEIIKELKKQTGVKFLYSIDNIANKKASITVTNADLRDVLKTLFEQVNLTYEENKGVVIIHQEAKSKSEKSVDSKKFLTVAGVVRDKNGNPLPGATVLIKATTKGTTTDANGNYTLKIPERTVLVFSFIGFQKQEITVSGEKEINVVMKDEASDLDEVTVIAYGTTTKRENTGAISTVKAKEIKDIPSPSIANILQGKVAGMDVTNISGAPGSGGANITIRGYNSLDVEQGRRFSNPLWVVDGVPLSSFTSPVTGTNLLSDLNPDMIESIEILKDASSAAMYGSRAANGVILVTTKSGQENQKATFSVNISQTYGILPELPTITIGKAERDYRLAALTNLKLLYYDATTNEYRYPNSLWDSYVHGGSDNRFIRWFDPNPFASGEPSSNGIILQDSLNSFYNNKTNFFPMYYQTGKTTNANIQVYGGTKKITYGIGLGYYNEKGILKGTGFSRLDLNANMTIQPVKKLYIDLRFNVGYIERERSAASRGLTGDNQIEKVSTEPYILSSLLPGEGSVVVDNVLNNLNGIDEKNRNIRIRTNFKIGYEILRGLTVSSNFATDFSYARRNTFTPSTLDENDWSKSEGNIGTNIMLLNENILEFKKIIKDVHTINIVVGSSYQYDQEESMLGWGMNSPSDDIKYVSYHFPDYVIEEIWGEETYIPFKGYESDMVEKGMVSFFGRMQYNYKKKYLFSASIRADGSSVFGKNNKWGYFPSFAAGWVFTEEPFMKNLKFLDFGKIRTSWGKSGNQFSNAYLALGILQVGNPLNGLSTIEPEWYNGLYNPDLSWEKTSQFDIGLELDMFNSRLSFTADYYLRNTKDLLYNVPIPGDGQYFSYYNQWRNAASISNSGVELMLSYVIESNKNFFWKIGINAAKNWNRFDNSYNGKDLDDYIIGKPLKGIYGFKTDGFYDSEEEIPIYFTADGQSSYMSSSSWGILNSTYYIGDFKYVDINGDRIINNEDKVYLGSALPEISGGITTELKYKNFDLNMMFSYQLGRHMINYTPITSSVTDNNIESYLKPILFDFNDYSFWENPGDDTFFPIIQDDYGYKNQIIVDRYVEKVNWIKLKTLILGYTLPTKISNRLGAESLRAFVSAENLFTLTNYSGQDPETVDIRTGLDAGVNYPLARKFTIGLTFKF